MICGKVSGSNMGVGTLLLGTAMCRFQVHLIILRGMQYHLSSSEAQ